MDKRTSCRATLAALLAVASLGCQADAADLSLQITPSAVVPQSKNSCFTEEASIGDLQRLAPLVDWTAAQSSEVDFTTEAWCGAPISLVVNNASTAPAVAQGLKLVFTKPGNVGADLYVKGQPLRKYFLYHPSTEAKAFTALPLDTIPTSGMSVPFPQDDAPQGQAQSDPDESQFHIYAQDADFLTWLSDVSPGHAKPVLPPGTGPILLVQMRFGFGAPTPYQAVTWEQGILSLASPHTSYPKAPWAVQSWSYKMIQAFRAPPTVSTMTEFRWTGPYGAGHSKMKGSTLPPPQAP